MPANSGSWSRRRWESASSGRSLVVVALGLIAAMAALSLLQHTRSTAPGTSAFADRVLELRAPDSPARAGLPAPEEPSPGQPVPREAPAPATARPDRAAAGSASHAEGPAPPMLAPPASVAAPSPAPSAPSSAEIEAEIIRLTNAERSAEDLPPLAHDPALDRIARAHSRDMLARGFFSHENPDGDGPTERAQKAGYTTRKMVEGTEMIGVGENIGMMPLGSVEDIGFVEREARSIASAQVRGWMDNRGHRSNILSEEYERIGVGVIYDGKGAFYCTQVFW